MLLLNRLIINPIIHISAYANIPSSSLRHTRLSSSSTLFSKSTHHFAPCVIQEKKPSSHGLLFAPPITTQKASHPSVFSTTRPRCASEGASLATDASDENAGGLCKRRGRGGSFWAAVGLILGTAVGPGMLGLPSATINSGPLPSTIAIILSWIYVISSILLVAELSYAAMEEENVAEVSFTGLATITLGRHLGVFVALVYALLTLSLMVACVSGIGPLVLECFPSMNVVLAHALFPGIVASLIGFLPFKAIDSANRLLCFLMLASITTLVATGLSSAGRANLLASFSRASWTPSAILPAIPVTVLTLGFHVITPFVCKVVGGTSLDARKAIILGGAVPLLMVLSWNLVVLGLAGTGHAVSHEPDPIRLLLSLNSSALPAVRGFVFSALGTSLIGYAVSFPKQLLDTLDLLVKSMGQQERQLENSPMAARDGGRAGVVLFCRNGVPTPGEVTYAGILRVDSRNYIMEAHSIGPKAPNLPNNTMVLLLVLGIPVVIASLCHAAFSVALDFAGVYANCFLFGLLPPLMAWIHRSRKKHGSIHSRHLRFLPGGERALLLLFSIAVVLGVC